MSLKLFLGDFLGGLSAQVLEVILLAIINSEIFKEL